MIYFITAIILTGVLLLYFRIANKFNIIDKPNQRSSHATITIRGGGVIFPLAGLLWFMLFGLNQPWIILALLLMAVVSFWDDVVTLSSKIRILVHFITVSVLFWQIQIYGLSWYYILIAYLFTLGWINAFNFMDGINGITAFYSLISLAAFGWINQSIDFFSDELIIVLVIAVLIFSFFNARKNAKIFAGDVGSVSMAFILAWLMIALMMKTGRIEYILFFALYGIDSVVTIIFRLLRRENIFKAHRSHLYQYLSNEMKLPQVLVSIIYAAIQLIINVFTIHFIQNGNMNGFVFGIIFISLLAFYLLIRGLVPCNNGANLNSIFRVSKKT